ncbi:MAG: signal recognition particle-docking protein FtsY [Puniceicoccales bacterium]|nr:signal recognition particle-docking protein FtsY [Puniceicoccales bacterium]
MAGFFKNLKRKLTQTVRSLSGKIKNIFAGVKLSAERLGEMEELLYQADFGRKTVESILDAVRESHSRNPKLRSEEISAIARRILRDLLEGSEGSFSPQSFPETICLVGINGSGKTTTAAKLAILFARRGHGVLLGSCDTFRAAANEQISLWASRLGVEIVQSCHGADAAAVAFDALSAAVARKKDLLILDTAGRLHTKVHLLDELDKVQRVLRKKLPEGIFHRWLVIDGHLGTNSLRQAEIFHGAFQLTGIVITKMDGTARGGALVSIYSEWKLPIYFVGIGEGADDLRPFSIEEYLDALFGQEEAAKGGK